MEKFHLKVAWGCGARTKMLGFFYISRDT